MAGKVIKGEVQAFHAPAIDLCAAMVSFLLSYSQFSLLRPSAV